MAAGLAARLEDAERHLAVVQAQVDAINARAAARHWTETDSAIGSGIRRKPNGKADSARFNRYDREAATFAELTKAEEAVRIAKVRIATATRNTPIPFSAGELKAAVVIRTAMGWHKVAKVNAKSVSVETGYSWVDRIPLEKIIEVRAA